MASFSEVSDAVAVVRQNGTSLEFADVAYKNEDHPCSGKTSGTILGICEQLEKWSASLGTSTKIKRRSVQNTLKFDCRFKNF